MFESDLFQIKQYLPTPLLDIANDIKIEGGQCILVGGCVRDFLLGLEPKDFDIEVYSIDDNALTKVLEKYGRLSLVGKSFGVFLLTANGVQFDFAFPRTESKTGKGHKGFHVKPDPNLAFEIAASRRDFTINAIGIELPQYQLHDPYNGIGDLKRSRLKHVGPAFGDDPLRALRAVQFVSRFELKCAPETVQICSEQNLSELSVERIEEEFKKWMVKSVMPSIGLELLIEAGLTRFFPELNFDHSTFVQVSALLNKGASREYKNDKERYYQMLAYLSFFVSEGERAKFLQRFSRETKLFKEIDLLLSNIMVVRNALSSQGSSPDYAIRKLSDKVILKEYLEFVTPVYSIIYEADSSKIILRCKELAKRLGVYSNKLPVLITGDDLLDIGLKQGKLFGDILRDVREMQYLGKVNDKRSAQEYLFNRIN